MNLHLSIDDKFYNTFIRNQKEYAPDTENEYYVISERKTLKSSPEDISVKIHSIAEMKNVLKASNMQRYQQVVFHSLSGSFRKQLLRHIPDGIKITWIFYGYEYYHRREVIRDYLGPSTRTYYDSRQNPHFFRLILQRILDKVRHEENQYKNDLLRIHRFAHWNPAEYTMIKDRYNLEQMEYVPFTMGQEVLKLVPDHQHRYLLMGHSGAITVNHLDGIEALTEETIASFDRILFPFSYGASKQYEAIVRKAAQNKIGEKALFLSRFMDRTSYFNLLSRVKAAWMPQLRGMGGGNILFCLKNNIPVIFWKDSMMYRFYTENGFHVFAIEDLDSYPAQLTRDQKENNRIKLMESFGEELLKKQYVSLLS